jgi:hypothetical protein
MWSYLLAGQTTGEAMVEAQELPAGHVVHTANPTVEYCPELQSVGVDLKKIYKYSETGLN